MNAKNEHINQEIPDTLPNGNRKSMDDLIDEKNRLNEKKRLKREEDDKRRRKISGDKRKSSSYLVDDSRSMERKRRRTEQDGHRKFARVNAREHNEEEQSAPEGDLQNSIQQHPWLNKQTFDGIDPNLNPEPPLNTAARREYDNERREQEMEKQLRLGNMPKFSTAPKPSGP